MADLHMFCETGAIGDTGLNLCRGHIALTRFGLDKLVVHTSPTFRFGDPRVEVPMNPSVMEIWRRTNFVREIVTDINYDDELSFKVSRKYRVPILQPMEFRDHHDIRDWIDLTDYIPEMPDGKYALFQPISLKMKPPNHLDDYIPVWDRCLKTLLRNDYKIIMVGGPDDPIDLCVKKEFLQDIDNKIGQWNILTALAFTLYKANVVVACDSWAAIWGAAARKKTAIAWGYRMENNIDFWVTGFLGNRDCYKYGWSSQKDYCDALLASYLSS